MNQSSKLFKGIRDVIYRLRYRTLKDPINKGYKLLLMFNYITWYLFYKYRGRKYIIHFQNNYKSYVYPYPDHDAGEANIFTRNVDFYDNEFIRKTLQPKDFIVDAGCNVGNRTWVLADLISGALLIDPNPTAILRAKENCKLNNLDFDKYFFVQKGVGDKEEQKQFTNLGGASTQNTIVTDINNWQNTISIDITTIDNVLKEISKIPAFIKIDVEGYDFKALKGAINTLKSGKVKLVKFENNNKELIEPIKEFFNNINWHVFTLDNLGNRTTNNKLILAANNLFGAPNKPLN